MLNIEEIDKVFARQLIPKKCLSKDTVENLFSLLFASARLGHLCLPVGKKMENWEELESVVSFEGEKRKPIIFDKGAFYLQKNWDIETKLTSQIARLLTPFLEDSFAYEIEGLSSEQKSAVEKASSHRLSLLSGGPGTGKTFTAAHIVKSFLQRNPSAKIALAAPTGKAAMQLKTSLQRQKIENIPCITLHNLLGIKREQDFFQEPRFLDFDLIIVDESSMIDAALFQYFFSCVPDHVRVVLMGDPFQLPSVGVGSIFSELVLLSETMPSIVCSRLKESRRCEKEEIIELAKEVKEGKVASCFSKLPEEWNVKESFQFVESFALNNFSFLSHLTSYETIFKKLDAVKILNCLRQGSFGADEINDRIAKAFFHKLSFGDVWIVPIILTKSQHDLDLYNGEIGLVFHKKKSSVFPEKFFSYGDYAVFPDRKEGSYRQMPVAALPPFTYAYALSVHKSQGSEYDKVLAVAPPGSEIFGKEVLYTAITRTKKEVEVLSSQAIIRQILEKSCQRMSNLHQRLKEVL